MITFFFIIIIIITVNENLMVSLRAIDILGRK